MTEQQWKGWRHMSGGVKADRGSVYAAHGARGNRGSGIQVLARSAKILRALAENPAGLTLAQIASRVGLARSTVHRIVVALEDQAWVHSIVPGYRLGYGLLALADAVRGNFEAEARPFLVRLSHELDETVDLSLLIGFGMTFVDQVVAFRRLRAVSAIGLSFPLHCTANGKAVLAAQDAATARSLLPAPLPALTPSTITDLDALEAELEAIRANDGIAFDRQEHTLGICAVGAALPTPDGGWAAISVPLPSQRFYGHEQEFKTAVLRCRDDLLSAAAMQARQAREPS
jgi:DNA-binding IclR family transcriptional regulator